MSDNKDEITLNLRALTHDSLMSILKVVKESQNICPDIDNQIAIATIRQFHEDNIPSSISDFEKM